MYQTIGNIKIDTNGPSLIEITEKISFWISKNKFEKGILNIYVMHTSASLIIQENADPDVLNDLLTFYIKIAPYDDKYKHQSEGEDDMPAHIKSSLTNTSVSVSVQKKELLLGTWQGIYLFEHRKKFMTRKINLHFIGE